MKERPILFSAPMVRALLAGSKTQTRRVMPQQPPAILPGYAPKVYWPARDRHMTSDPDSAAYLQFERPGDYDGMNVMRGGFGFRCRYGQPGDRLWVRETWNTFDGWAGYHYAADYEGFGIGQDDDPDHVPDHAVRWKPSIHMPRAASRITLEITGVRVERLQTINRGDAMAEGCPFPNMAAGPDPREWFRELWQSINGTESWAANPWVWVVEFRRLP